MNGRGLSETLLTDDLWPTLEIESQRSSSLMGAVAYVANTVGLRFRHGDLLVLDASDRAVAWGKTSAARIQDLFELGVQLHSHPGDAEL